MKYKDLYKVADSNQGNNMPTAVPATLYSDDIGRCWEIVLKPKHWYHNHKHPKPKRAGLITDYFNHGYFSVTGKEIEKRFNKIKRQQNDK